MNLDLDSLRCFVAVARTLKFRTAAETLGMSVTAVSERMARLEENLGVVLLERTTRRVALTEAGLRLLPHARALLDQAEKCGVVARGDGRPSPFSLTIGTRYELGLSWLVPALRPLSEARPERTIHLYMGDTADLLERLERGLVDACVLSAGPRRASIRQRLLHEEQYVLVAARSICLNAQTAPHHTLLDATPDLPLFQYFRDLHPEVADWSFGRHLYLGGIGAIRALALDRQGIAVLPLYFVRADLDAGRLVALADPCFLGRDHFRLLWRDDHPRATELDRLADALRAFPLQ